MVLFLRIVGWLGIAMIVLGLVVGFGALFFSPDSIWVDGLKFVPIGVFLTFAAFSAVVLTDKNATRPESTRQPPP